MSKMKKVDDSEVTFIAMSMNCYGRGNRVDDALSNLKSSGGTIARCKVYMFPKGANSKVDGLGRMGWDVPEDKTNYDNDDYAIEVYSKGKFDE